MTTFQDRMLAAHAREARRRADAGLRKLTKSDVWRAAGATSSAASHWYGGSNGADLDTCFKIAQVLRCSPLWLFDEREPMDGPAQALAPELPANSDPESVSTIGRHDANVEPGPPIRGCVPLISWVQAGTWRGIVDNFAPGDAEEWLPCPRHFGPHTFALRVHGLSMEPQYQSGDIIFVDPDARAEHGKHVVVRLDDKREVTFKQLVVEDGQRFLRALNPDWPPPKLIPIEENATICGVVIGKWVPK